MIANISLTLFRLQAEADFFSSVSLNDFNIICTLGMGGFSRVELVREPRARLRHSGDASQPMTSSLLLRAFFYFFFFFTWSLLSGAAEERDQSIVRPQSVEEAPHRGHQPAGSHHVGAPNHDGGSQPLHRQVRRSLKVEEGRHRCPTFDNI